MAEEDIRLNKHDTTQPKGHGQADATVPLG